MKELGFYASSCSILYFVTEGLDDPDDERGLKGEKHDEARRGKRVGSKRMKEEARSLNISPHLG